MREGGDEGVSGVLTVGDVLAARARLRPEKLAAKDSRRSLTFQHWDERSTALANAMLGLGLSKGDRVAVLAYNCLEWMELYVALARAGLIAVPMNFRLAGREMTYIVQDCQAAALVVQHDLVDVVTSIAGDLDIPADRFVHFGATSTPEGWSSYETLIGQADLTGPSVTVVGEDTWALMYTSGTTGRPKGAIRSHQGTAVMSLVTALDMGFSADEIGLLVMPMCHANSLYFSFALAYIGATCIIDDHHSFDPEELLRTLAANRVTFTSLVPTHYIMIVGLPEAIRRRYDVSRVRKLMISSAPARRDTKLAVMDYFTNSGLYELYGSTEAGWVTLLRPDEQLSKAGSVGREWTGSGAIRLIGPDGQEVADGEVGELFSRTPYTFDGYWNDPVKTQAAFRGAWCSVGDLARRDQDGYYFLVDRKSNMIISGGENVYPSEVENLIGSHPAVRDVAVIGLPDDVWGERVHAVVVAHPDADADEQDLLAWCKDRIAGYKRPRSLSFIAETEMPRTLSGKILHRALRERWLASGTTTPAPDR
jgi:acyl-CoA synthetase (AMP-forming)/AMP-acid ligase II